MRPFAHIFANLRKTAKNKLHNSTTSMFFFPFMLHIQRVQQNHPTLLRFWFRLKDSKALPWSYPQRSGRRSEDSESSGPPWRGADGLPWWCGYVQVPAWRWKIRGKNGVGKKKPMEKWNDNESGGVVSFLSGNLWKLLWTFFLVGNFLR